VATHPELTIRIESVGSTNGIWLAAFGMADLGLTSRSLWEEERALGVTVLPYAKTALVVGTDPTVVEDGLTTAELLDIYRGGKRRWRGGQEIALLARQKGDSSIEALRATVPGFAAAYATGEQLGWWNIFYSEESMLEALVSGSFSVGLTDLGTMTIERLPIKPLSIDGATPTLDNVASGRYRLTKTLSFVFRTAGLSPAAHAFVRFVRSEEARSLLRTSGYLPVDGR